MIRLIYASRASRSLDGPALDRLAERARQRNAHADVTGLLLFLKGEFLQILEGPDGAVAGIFESIRRDPRHQRVKLLYREPVSVRLFASWPLGVVSDVQEHEALPLAEILHDAALDQGGTQALELARLFAARTQTPQRALLPGR